MLKIIEKAKCLPVTLKEARDQLSVDASNSSMDALINGLIVASSANAETMTGRVLVESKWQWEPEAIVEGVSIPFPTAPVTVMTPSAAATSTNVITVVGHAILSNPDLMPVA